MLEYLLMVLSGFLIGALNYAIMKFTINKFLITQKYHVMFLSFFGRNIVILLLFYVLMNNDWKRILLLLLGFVIAKFAFLGMSLSKIKNKKRKGK